VPKPSASSSSAWDGASSTWPEWKRTTGRREPSWPHSPSSAWPSGDSVAYQPCGMPMRVSVSRSWWALVPQRGPTILMPSNARVLAGVHSASTWLMGTYRKRSSGSHGSNR
jgi:hypothetical protein